MSRKKMPADVSRKAASPVEFCSNSWLPVRTPTGALVTVFGVDYANEDEEVWDNAVRVALVIRPVRYDDNKDVDEGECHRALMSFASALGKKAGSKSWPPFVAALEGSPTMGRYYSIIFNLSAELEPDDVFEAFYDAWPDFSAIPEVIHATSGPDEVRHLLGRTQYHSQFHVD